LCLSFFDQTGLNLFFEPVRITLDVDGGGVMKQSIKNSRGNDRITKNFVPLGETTVGGEDHGSFLITARDKLGEEMSAVTVNRNVADISSTIRSLG